ncbi:MAG: hypothetical protein IPN17_31010, partial [Deltaproteobacteria bacterium]|nr:hypothetical protein [Deltaproteobacteria bacterium]
GTRVTAQRPIYLGHTASVGAQQRVPGEGASVDLSVVPMCREARWQTTFRRERRSISTQGFAGGVFTGLGGTLALAGGIGALQDGRSLSAGEIDGSAIVFIGGAALAAVGVVLLGVAAADPHDTEREAGHSSRASWIGEPTACRPDVEVPAEPPGLSVALEAGDAPPIAIPQQDRRPRGLLERRRVADAPRVVA